MNNKTKKIIKNGFYNYAITLEEEFLNEKTLDFLIKKVDFRQIPLSVLIKNERILNKIHESNISSDKIISIIFYNPDSINQVKLDKFSFKTNELITLITTHPQLLDYFDLDLSEINFRQFVNLYSINKNVLNKVDVSKYKKQNSDDINYVIKRFISNKEIVKLLDFSILKANDIKEIIINHGKEFLNDLDLKKLKPLDYFQILKSREDLLEEFDISNIFKEGDGFLLASLVIIYEKLDYLIEKNKENLGALAWEKLIIHNPEKYLKIADLDKLREKNWSVIVKERPQLKSYYFF